MFRVQSTTRGYIKAVWLIKIFLLRYCYNNNKKRSSCRFQGCLNSSTGNLSVPWLMKVFMSRYSNHKKGPVENRAVSKAVRGYMSVFWSMNTFMPCYSYHKIKFPSLGRLSQCRRQRCTGACQRVEHFLCFDHTDFSTEQAKASGSVRRGANQRTVITTEEVGNGFRKTNSRSARGPDHILGAVLRQCHSSLASVFTRLFQSSLDTGYISCYGRPPS